MIGLDAAIEYPGLRIAAWDRSREGDGQLTIVAIGRDAVTVLTRETVAHADRARVEERLKNRGVLIGSTYRGCPFVWVVDDARFAVVSLDKGHMVTDAFGTDLVVGGQRFRIADVQVVVSFVDTNDIAHRGVKLQLADGREPIVAEERDPGALFDPTYGRQNLELDAGWIVVLGRELATNLGVEHHDELWHRVTPPARPRTDRVIEGLMEAYERWEDPDRVAKRQARATAEDARNKVILDQAYIESGQRGDAPMDVAVAKMADYFAGRIEREIAASGPFTSIYQPLPELDNGGYIALDLKPTTGERRLLELRVESPSGENKACEVVRDGTTADLVRFLRSSELVEQLLPLMTKLTDATRES